jgi:hypothetical protein
MKILKRISGLLASAVSLLGGLLPQLEHAVDVVNIVKAAVQSNDSAPLATAFLPKDWDSTALARVRAGIHDVAQDLRLPEVTQGQQSAFRNQLADLVAFIQEQPAPHQSAIYAKTASILAQKLSGGKLTEAEADTLVQVVYTHKKAAEAA